MITLEAFITKANIKQAINANSVDKKNYEELIKGIDFTDADFEMCYQFKKRLTKAKLMPTMKNLPDMENIEWTFAPMKDSPYHMDSEHMGLFAWYSTDVNGVKGTGTVEICGVMQFHIDKDSDIIYYCDKNSVQRNKNDNKALYKVADKIARGLGYTEWDDEDSSWSKPNF